MSIKFIIFLVFFIIFWCSVISFIVWGFFYDDKNTHTTTNKKFNDDSYKNPMDVNSVFAREVYRQINDCGYRDDLTIK